jgi:hypothetical protein
MMWGQGALHQRKNGAHDVGQGMSGPRRAPIGVLPDQDQPAARPVQLFVRAQRGEVRLVNGAGVQSRRDEARRV